MKGIITNVVIVSGHMDYIEAYDGKSEAPEDAIYVAVQGDKDTTVIIDKTEGVLESKHTYAGWENPKAAK